jgi:hypothetical protein
MALRIERTFARIDKFRTLLIRFDELKAAIAWGSITLPLHSSTFGTYCNSLSKFMSSWISLI